MARILIVEDEEGIASFIKRGLALKGYEAEVAADGESGLTLFRERTPDLVVLDLMLPDIDGIEVCRRIRAAGDTPVIMLTALDSVPHKVEGLEVGADDYVTKPFAFDELVARIRAALRRKAPGEEVITVGDLTIRPASREVERSGRPIELTNREYELLEYLARNAGKVMDKRTIFEKVWGFDFEVESDAIKVYVSYLRKKLNAPGERDLIRAVRGVGYIIKG
jgi:two-component system response regulator MprA